MEQQLLNAFEPYRHLDPMGWVGVYRFLPVWGGLACAVVGLVLMLFGGRQLFRLVAGPLGVLIAAAWAVPLAQRMGLQMSLKQVANLSMIGLFLAGLLFPQVVVFFAFGIPSGLLGGELVGANDWILGFGPCFLVGGGIGVVLHRVVGAVASAAAGAWMLVLGLLAVLTPVLPPMSWFGSNPTAVLTIAAVFGLAGAVFQIFVRPSEAEASTRKIEKALNKKKQKEQKALEARWEKYNNRDE